MWCLFPPIRTCFLACKHFPLADIFMTKARYYRFSLHQTQSKHDSNVCKKAWWTLFIVNPVLDTPACPLTQEVGRGGGLGASYTRTSTDSDSGLLSSRIRPEQIHSGTHLVWLIHDSQFRCIERDRTAGKIPVQLAPIQVQVLKVCREVCMWLWLTMLAEFVKNLWNNFLMVSL